MKQDPALLSALWFVVMCLQGSVSLKKGSCHTCTCYTSMASLQPEATQDMVQSVICIPQISALSGHLVHRRVEAS